MKKILYCILICSFVSITLIPAGAVNAEKVQVGTTEDKEMDQEEMALINENNSIHINEQELEIDICENDIPTEVADALIKIFKQHPNAEVTVYKPLENDNSKMPRGVSSSWSSNREYKGYILKDWIIKTENAFGMVSINSGSKAKDFADTILFYMAGAIADTQIPFTSAGMTIAQFLVTNYGSVTASTGDKTSVAPRYTTYEKFTYVVIDNQNYLGTKSYKSTLNSIAWYYYSSVKNKQYNNIVNYNKTVPSLNYNFPDSTALSCFGSGGYLDESISMSIGGREFLLS